MRRSADGSPGSAPREERRAAQAESQPLSALLLCAPENIRMGRRVRIVEGGQPARHGMEYAAYGAGIPAVASEIPGRVPGGRDGEAFPGPMRRPRRSRAFGVRPHLGVGGRADPARGHPGKGRGGIAGGSLENFSFGSEAFCWRRPRRLPPKPLYNSGSKNVVHLSGCDILLKEVPYDPFSHQIGN